MGMECRFLADLGESTVLAPLARSQPHPALPRARNMAAAHSDIEVLLSEERWRSNVNKVGEIDQALRFRLLVRTEGSSSVLRVEKRL